MISFPEALILINHIFHLSDHSRRFMSSSFSADASLRLDGSMQISLLPATSLAPEYSDNAKFSRPCSVFALVASNMWKLWSQLLF
jgi:hypothetical protein